MLLARAGAAPLGIPPPLLLLSRRWVLDGPIVRWCGFDFHGKWQGLHSPEGNERCRAWAGRRVDFLVAAHSGVCVCDLALLDRMTVVTDAHCALVVCRCHRKTPSDVGENGCILDACRIGDCIAR